MPFCNLLTVLHMWHFNECVNFNEGDCHVKCIGDFVCSFVTIYCESKNKNL